LATLIASAATPVEPTGKNTSGSLSLHAARLRHLLSSQSKMRLNVVAIGPLELDVGMNSRHWGSRLDTADAKGRTAFTARIRSRRHWPGTPKLRRVHEINDAVWVWGSANAVRTIAPDI
jgi:hypothetical protein